MIVSTVLDFGGRGLARRATNLGLDRGVDDDLASGLPVGRRRDLVGVTKL